MYNTNSQIKLKTPMLKSSLCNYGVVYILLTGTVTVNNLAVGGNTNIQVAFKCCVLFADCISQINNTQIDNAKDIGVLTQMYNSIAYSDNYLKKSGSLWQYYIDGFFK